MGSEMTPLLVFEGGASEAPPRGTTRIRYAVGGRVKALVPLGLTGNEHHVSALEVEINFKEASQFDNMVFFRLI